MENLELMNYMGCGMCDNVNGAKCVGKSTKVEITFKNDEYWDNGARMVKVFNKGDVVEGKAIILDNKVYCASAESTIYEGIIDFIDLKNVESIKKI